MQQSVDGAGTSHLDPDVLAVRALGEPVDAADLFHLSACARCAGELAAFEAVVATARSIDVTQAPETPPPSVWHGIHDELGLDHRVETRATVTRLPDRTPSRRWSSSFLVAASAAGVLLGSVVTGLVVQQSVAPDESPPPVVASAELAALPDRAGTGTAELVTTDSGTQLVLDVSGLSEGEGFYEVWLIDPETLAMVGLGALPGTRGTFAVPDGLDLTRYSLVDVSIEPFDGDPVHSRDSVVQGQLTT